MGETFAIMWDDIDFQNAKLTINKQVQHNGEGWQILPPKYGSSRTIDLDDTMIALLKSEFDRQESCRQTYGQNYNRLYKNDQNVINTISGKEIYPVCRRENGLYIQPRIMQHVGRVTHIELGIKEYDYHSLRHTHTTNLIQAGANIKYVQERLGHKNVQVTLNIYAHVTDRLRDEQKKILNRL